MFATEEDRIEHLNRLSYIVSQDKGTLIPMIFCDMDGENTCMAAPMSGTEDKNAIVGLLHKLIVHKRITFFSMALESWVTTIPDHLKDKVDMDELMKVPGNKRPFTHDIVMVTFSNPKEEITYFAKIVVAKDGSRSLDKWEKQDYQQAVGRFTNIWNNAIAITN